MSAILTRPIAAAFSVSRPRNIEEPAKSLPRRLLFSGEISCRNYVSWDIRRRGLSKMKGFKSAAASMKDDGVPAFVDESLTLEEGGIDATINNLSKWIMSLSFCGLLVWKHDAEAVWACLGSALNGTLSITLKNILNQERPDSTLRSDPGMPSSHSQSIAYTFAFFIISLVEWLGVNALTITLSGVLVILGFYFAWLRFKHGFHTVSQVVVGGIVGSVFSFLWWCWWKTYVHKLFVSYLFARIVITVTAIVALVGVILLKSYQGRLYDV